MKQKIEVPICAHVKTNGTQCQSPAMSDSYFCYFHERLHQRHKRYRANEAKKLYLEHTRHIQLHALEDAESVQLAISLVVNALATGELNHKSAGPLLNRPPPRLTEPPPSRPVTSTPRSHSPRRHRTRRSRPFLFLPVRLARSSSRNRQSR